MKTLKITFCLMFCCAVFVGNVFADEQIVLQIPDINFDSNIDMLDFSELAKYWGWEDLREQNNFETYQDYADFWDPNSLNPDSYHYVGFDAGGQQFDFNKDSLVDSLERALQNISILSNSVKREFWGVDYIPGGEKDNFGTYLSEFGAFHEIYLTHGR